MEHCCSLLEGPPVSEYSNPWLLLSRLASCRMEVKRGPAPQLYSRGWKGEQEAFSFVCRKPAYQGLTLKLFEGFRVLDDVIYALEKF